MKTRKHITKWCLHSVTLCWSFCSLLEMIYLQFTKCATCCWTHSFNKKQAGWCCFVSPVLLRFGLLFFLFGLHFLLLYFPWVSHPLCAGWATRQVTSVHRRWPLTSGTTLMVTMMQFPSAPDPTMTSHLRSKCFNIIWWPELLHCPVLALAIQPGTPALTDAVMILTNAQFSFLRDGLWFKWFWYSYRSIRKRNICRFQWPWH